MISLECAVDSELNDAIAFAVSCSVAELTIHRNHKNQRPKTTTQFCFQHFHYQNVLALWFSKHFKAVDLVLKQNFTK